MPVTEGYVTAADGVRLFFQKVGDGRSTVVVPNAVYLFDDFKHLGAEHTCIFYDLRNRGRSDEVTDDAMLKGGVHNDVQDVEAVRRHFELEEMSVMGHSYVGTVVALYALEHPQHVSRVVQIGPAAPNMTKRYPPDLTNMDATATQVFARLAQMQNESGPSDAVEACKRAWAVLRPLYVFDQANVHKIFRMGFCELANERNAMRYFQSHIMPTLQCLNISAADCRRASMPVLTIHGTKDRNAPYGGGLDWARSLPNARLLTVDDAAHVPWIEAPELVFGSIKTFLDGLWPESAKTVA
jgi:pimeloyl-ACP methyl ester carboxylesterase